MQTIEPILNQILPWLGGGAVTAIASFTAWVWLNYFKRSDSQWDKSNGLIEDIKAERDHWRAQAQSKNGEMMALQDLISELRRSNSELERKNSLLQIQNDILAEEKGNLEGKVESLYATVERLKARLSEVDHISEVTDDG